MIVEPYIATFTGGKAYPLGLNPDDVRIEDIAHSLSQQCRYAGHTREFWSVAAHSIEVSYKVLSAYYSPRDDRFHAETARQLALAGLLHDAGEAYLTDVPRPIKPMFVGYDVWQQNVDATIAKVFNLDYPWNDLVEECDKAMIPLEVANFFRPGSAAWRRYGIEKQLHTLAPLSPKEGEARFLERYYWLTNRQPGGF